MKATVEWHPWQKEVWHARRPSEGVAFPRFRNLTFTDPDQRGDLLGAFLEIVDGARERVFCCSFLLGGKKVTQALRNAAQRLRGHVYVVTAASDRDLARSLAEEIDEAGLVRESKRFPILTKSGVYVRTTATCHAKFLVVDDKVALLSTANFDRNGLGQPEGDPTAEIGYRIKSRRRVDGLGTLFRHVWRTGCDREARPDPRHYALVDAPIQDQPAPDSHELRPGGIVWTGFGSTAILDTIRQLSDDAQEHLILASYSFRGMVEQPGLVLDHLLRARRRGVDVELLLRNRARDLPELAPLVDAGVQVRSDRTNHAKYVVADGKVGAFFSANLDGTYGLTQGVEAGTWLTKPETKELLRYHHIRWANATHEAVRFRDVDHLQRRLPRCRMGGPWGKNPGYIAIHGDRATVDKTLGIARSACLLTWRQASEGELLLLGRDTGVLLTPASKRWKASEAPQQSLARFIAAGRPTEAWIPVGLEIRAES